MQTWCMTRAARRVGLFLLALMLISPARAEPSCKSRVAAQTAVVCSATWQFTGRCNAPDMVHEWKVHGIENPPDAYIRPFSDDPILVIGYELVKVTGTSAKPWRADKSWFMIGSTIQSDAMIWLAPGETHAKTFWPAGTGQPWPSKKDARPVTVNRNEKGQIVSMSGDLLDLHGWCPKDEVVGIMLTVYYTGLEQTPESSR
jgi:hypothetical protein